MKITHTPQIDWNIWKNYALAMKKNGKKPLSFGRFQAHIEGYCWGISQQDSYLFGEMIDEVLFVSHWSPSSNRGGVNLLSDILDLNFQVVLNVLPGKMSNMLSRLGLHCIGEIEVDYPLHQKKIMFSNQVGEIPPPEPDEYEVRAIEHGFDY